MRRGRAEVVACGAGAGLGAWVSSWCALARRRGRLVRGRRARVRWGRACAACCKLLLGCLAKRVVAPHQCKLADVAGARARAHLLEKLLLVSEVRAQRPHPRQRPRPRRRPRRGAGPLRALHRRALAGAVAVESPGGTAAAWPAGQTAAAARLLLSGRVGFSRLGWQHPRRSEAQRGPRTPVVRSGAGRCAGLAIFLKSPAYPPLHAEARKTSLEASSQSGASSGTALLTITNKVLCRVYHVCGFSLLGSWPRPRRVTK